MIEAGGSKQRIKAMLSKGREASVPLKTIYNLDTKIRLSKQTNNRKDDFKHLIDMMTSVPNARTRIITDDQDKFIGLYFQDERMAHLYEKYPEILFYDATHDLNNKKFPLFIQLCIDGNGNSEIVSLYICVSESREGVGSMIDAFKELNPSWTKTKVILGDKDFADRGVYSEKFTNAVMKICIFHVLRTFRREITIYKREITSSQRDDALIILQRLVYSSSEEQYEAAYSELINLNLEHVTNYYNENWHCIREQWTIFGLNENCSYMNATNNRMESLNQKLKLIGSRHANLQSFFENLTISISNSSSEKDLAAVRGKMRRSRQCFDDPVLQSYKDFLTPFAFNKMETQYELASHVEFTFIEDGEAIINNKRVDIVSSTTCSCLFFSSMQLPCRHIMKLSETLGGDAFKPDLCATRWTKAYFEDSHPALHLQKKIISTKAVYTRVRDQNVVDQYKKNVAVVKEVKEFVFGLSPANQSRFVDAMKNFPNEISAPSRPVAHTGCAVQNSQRIHSNEVFPSPLDLSKPSTRPPVDNLNPPSATSFEPQDNQLDINKENCGPPIDRSLQKDATNQPSAFSSSQPIAILSSIENIKLPSNVKAVGRPKGSSLTVIGTKRKKQFENSSSSKRIVEDGSAQKFIEKSPRQRGLTIIQWLTSGTSKTKISSKDIVIDVNVFNRLRNDEVSLDHLKEFVEDECYDFLQSELSKIKNQPWICSKYSITATNDQAQKKREFIPQ
ncbi:hypothetical protein HA402_002805 [Bradysia odoriphaga]|nr:hypothetical protein HA402_002805 [Bradysia odoriphaga]